jgi:hypothetical protein
VVPLNLEDGTGTAIEAAVVLGALGSHLHLWQRLNGNYCCPILTVIVFLETITRSIVNRYLGNQDLPFGRYKVTKRQGKILGKQSDDWTINVCILHT